MTPAEEAAKVRKTMGKGLCVCILGSTKFSGSDSEDLVKALGGELAKSVDASQAFFVTGGMEGVQECFAKSCGDGSNVWNLLPVGESSKYGVGTDVHAGANLEERKAIFGQLGDVYITIEGGPGVSQEAKAAHDRGATILPLIRSGGASSGMFEFPKAALERPDCATEEQWSLLQNKEAQVEKSAQAVVAVVQKLAKKHNASIWEIIDDLIGFERGTLLKALGVVVAVLVTVSCCMIYQEVAKGETMMALLHGGFLFLVIGLVASIAWVVSEVSRLEDEKSQEDGAAVPTSEADKKAQ